MAFLSKRAVAGVFSIAVIASPAAAATDVCPGPDQLQAQHYVVSSVQVRTPLVLPSKFLNTVFFSKLNRLLQPDPAAMPIKPAQVFTRLSYFEGMDFIQGLQEAAGSRILSPSVRVRIALVLPSVENCTSPAAGNAGTVDVVYKVYTTDAAYFLGQIFETRFDRATRSLSTASTADGRFQAQPFLGYNAARGFLGGAKASYSLNAPWFDHINGAISVANSSYEGTASLSGQKESDSGLWSHFEWSAGYAQSSLPIGSTGLNSTASAKLDSGTVWLRLFAASRAISPAELILRFGGAVEGGLRDSNAAIPTAVPDVVSSGRHGAVKGYLGTTFNHGRNAFTASYGLQAGKRSDSYDLGYIKQLVDVAYRSRWLATEHRPIRIDADFGWGHISQISGDMPLGERFFGGNVEQRFIDGDSWRLRSAPFIRGVPQYRLGWSPTLGAAVGGDSFVSANLTVARPVWVYPAIPNEIRHDADLYGGLMSANILVLKTSMDEYVARSAQFQALLPVLDEIEEQLKDYDRIVASIEAANPPDSTKDLIQSLKDAQEGNRDLAGEIRDDPQGPATRGKLRRLLSDSSATDAGNALADALPSGPQQDDLRTIGARLAQIQADAATKLDQVDAALVFAPAPALKTVFDDVQALEAPLSAILNIADNLPDGVSEQIAQEASQVKAAARLAHNKIPSPTDTPRDKLLMIDDLITGFGKTVPALAEDAALKAEVLAKLLETSPAPMTAEAKALQTHAQTIETGIRHAAQHLALVQRPPGERWSRRETAYFRNTIDVLVREFNVAAVSPVVTFDAARLWANPAAELGGVHTSMGFGGRLSLASADFTLGYAWNLTNTSGTGRGALFFSLDIVDLFR